MGNLKELENKTIFIIREVYNRFKNPALLWSIGKDSTTLLWLIKKAFYGNVPFPVIHIDTGYKFKEIYEFRKKHSSDLNLIIAKKETNTSPKNKFKCCNIRKTEALKEIVEKYGFDALIIGIRRDEHGIRNKERYFSPRDKEFKWNYAKASDKGDSPLTSLQDAEFDGWNIFATDFGNDTNHVRVHPLLHWSELDIWEYIKKEDIPAVNLYFAKNGKRYRSIGCKCCCEPINSNANTIAKIIQELKKTNTSERAGRSQDKEDENNMEKLRSLGYM